MVQRENLVILFNGKVVESLYIWELKSRQCLWSWCHLIPQIGKWLSRSAFTCIFQPVVLMAQRLWHSQVSVMQCFWSIHEKLVLWVCTLLTWQCTVLLCSKRLQITYFYWWLSICKGKENAWQFRKRQPWKVSTWSTLELSPSWKRKINVICGLHAWVYTGNA